MREGRIHVAMRGPRLLEARVEGFVTHAMVAESQREIECLLAAAPGPLLYLRDGLAMGDFEPGVPFASIRWARAHRAAFARTAIVTRRPAYVGISSAFATLIPSLPQRVFGTRAEALAWLGERAPAASVAR
jgi:hypothetical protein